MWIYILLVIYYVILLCYYIISYKCIILDGFFYYYIMRYLMFDHTKKHHIICTLTSTDRYIYIYTLLRFADSSTLDTTLLNTWNLGLHLQWRTSAEHVVKIETLQAGQGPCETSWDSRWRYWKQNTLLMHTNAYYTWLHLILMNAFIYMCIYIYIICCSTMRCWPYQNMGFWATMHGNTLCIICIHMHIGMGHREQGGIRVMIASYTSH